MPDRYYYVTDDEKILTRVATRQSALKIAKEYEIHRGLTTHIVDDSVLGYDVFHRHHRLATFPTYDQAVSYASDYARQHPSLAGSHIAVHLNTPPPPTSPTRIELLLDSCTTTPDRVFE